MELDYFASPGPLTKLTSQQVSTVRAYSANPGELGRAVQRLLISPGDAFGTGLSEQRMAERNTRRATDLIKRATELDPADLDKPRDAKNRVVGTCRHHALLTTAMLRANDVPARARCGFASYFVSGKYVDHWVTEYWRSSDERWVRIDSEILDLGIVDRPDDLQVGQFMSGGEAWQQTRQGAVDAMDFGVIGTENWGPGEIRGNVIRDVAALMKIEMLPWDNWGSMEASYDGETGADFNQLMDEAAIACASNDRRSLEHIYSQIAVPLDLIV